MVEEGRRGRPVSPQSLLGLNMGRLAAAALLRDLGRFLLLTSRKARRDGITLTASALAFITVLALVPLMAAFSFIGARVFHQYNDRALEVFVRVLPYSETTIVDKLDQFLSQAETLQGFGLLGLLIVSISAFATVEQTINKVWHVPRRRPLKVRFLSFTLLLFWGPLLIGATFSALLLLRSRPGFDALFEESLLLNALPFLVTVTGLTMLYWVVPYTTVELRCALAGGVTAALLLELLRQGFTLYIRTFDSMNVVYGGFALALLFIISIQLAWLIVLIGSEVAYTAQHFRELERTEGQLAALQASWVGLVALAVIGERFARGEPTIAHERLAAARRSGLDGLTLADLAAAGKERR
jgi:membrane protein